MRLSPASPASRNRGSWRSYRDRDGFPQGLEKARARQYGLFLVDVEMPGMNGFEFVSRTRADARLSKTPAILVTSRNAPEDRRRGEQAGASAYIVKGEFDQSYLLRMTRELVGWT